MKVLEKNSSYESLLCADCKKNIALEMSKLTKKDLLRPRRIAKKSASWICDKCRSKIAEQLKRSK